MESSEVKLCKKCGARDRCPTNGRCRPCRRASQAAYQSAYSASPKGRAYQSAYNDSPEGLASRRVRRSRHHHKKIARGCPLHGPVPPKPADGLCENIHCRNDRLPGKQGLHVDHDHSLPENNFRAWLCGLCNAAQGSLGDNPDALEWCARRIRQKRGEQALSSAWRGFRQTSVTTEETAQAVNPAFDCLLT